LAELGGGDFKMFNRNDRLGLIERARKNLEFIEGAEANGADVHIVTQLLITLLGLVVFPVEGGFDKDVQHLTLEELENRGWPKWDTTIGNTKTLGQLLRNLRNAIAHRGVIFSSEARTLEEVHLEFWNQWKEQPIHWRSNIAAKDLRAFCDNLMKFILMG
jgi:HEPN pEK499 p136